MNKLLKNNTITPTVSYNEWSTKYPNVDREYIWIYPLINNEEFNPHKIFKDSEVPLCSTDTVIYIHVPTCLFACPMCPFYFEIINDKKELNGYVDALIKELEMYVNSNIIEKLNLKTIYFGGGTASLLPAKDIGKLIKRIKELIPYTEEIEITLECHPSVIDYNYLSQVYDEGINRVSLGIQSFQDKALNIIRRKQTAEINRRIITDAVNIGFNTVSADLIYRIPGQTIQDVINDVSEAISLGVTSLSTYSLEFNVRESNLQEQQPSEEIDKEMFYTINKILKDEGWNHVAQPDYSAPNHIHKETMVTWKAPQGQWFSLGAGAWSTFNGNTYCNVHDMKEYKKVVNDGYLPILAGHTFSLEDAMSRYMVLGIRCFDIPNAPFEKSFNISLFDVFKDEIDILCKQGLISTSNYGLKVTEKGKYYVDNISKVFYSLSNRCRLQPWGAKSKGDTAPFYIRPKKNNSNKGS